jgi:pimeloyl-ACP methyl ester carboxylesterase
MRAKTGFAAVSLVACAAAGWFRTLERAHVEVTAQKSETQSATGASSPVELPYPTGPFAVGTRIYNWTDRSRVEKATGKAGDFRQLAVQVWYPTRDASGPTAPYVPMLTAYRGIWEEPEIEIAQRVTTHSRTNKPPLAGMKLPVVVFSHGWQGTRSEYTSVAEDLASHRYAVFGIDHPYMGRVVLPNGKVTEPTEDQFESAAEIRTYYGRDVQFAVDEIARLNAAMAGTFAGRLDLTRVAAIGHSSGFVAAGTACKMDRRITACVNVDAPKFTASLLAGLNQPLLWIRLERAGGVPREFLETQGSAVYELQLARTNHGSIQDWDYLSAKSSPERDKAAENLRLVRMYLGAFLNATLKNEKAPLLKRKPDRSSATLVIYERKSVETRP